jgi:hypothetical protein
MDKEAAREAMRETALQAVQRHWRYDHRNCAICGADHWSVAQIFQMPEFESVPSVGIRIGAPTMVFPVVPVTCRTCGYTLFFNAVMLGLAPGPPEQASP